MKNEKNVIPYWITPFLKLAGAYNIVWGIYILENPLGFYKIFNKTDEFPLFLYPIGGLVLGLGVAYWIASYQPRKYWFFSAAGFLTKSASPVGNWVILTTTQIQWDGYLLATFCNDVIWIIPFGLATYYTMRK
ncbi:MAG: hypothetical protein SFU27_14160 [Thermonemataceae bacterium]|nr:hypothetical protein [Thermonemataceae bacterium]